jgi:hypothetical protein
MSATVLTLTVEPGVLDTRWWWSEFESLAVQMGKELPGQALASVLADAQERLIDSVCGPRWTPVRGLPAPFGCPRCGAREDFARKGKRTRTRKLHTAAGPVELVLWNVGCRECGRVFAPLLVMLGLSGKRRTDRLTVDLAELGTQVSVARAAEVSRQLASTTATAGQAHHSLADTAALLTGTEGTLGPGHPSPDVVMLDGTGARAGTNKNGVGVHLALGLTGRSGPAGRRRAHTHLLGLTVGQDWPAMAAQLAGLPAPALVVLDGETDLTTLTQQLWPTTPIQRCWWHLPHGLRKAFYSDDAANRHVNPHWARYMSDQLAQLLRDTLRHEQTTEQALAAWDTFTQTIPNKLTSAHSYLASARDHAFTCLDPDLRSRLARLGGPELGTGVLERVMRELNARTDIGARPLEHGRAARSAHRAHRTTTPPPGPEGDQTGHPPAQHHPIPPAKVQRLTTLPKHLMWKKRRSV